MPAAVVARVEAAVDVQGYTMGKQSDPAAAVVARVEVQEYTMGKQSDPAAWTAYATAH
jgi:hypothetical protein